MISVDPTFLYVTKLAVGIVFIVGALQKLQDIEVFEMAVETYDLLPDFLVPGFSRIMPVAELIAACLLIANYNEGQTGLILASVVMATTTIGVTVNLIRGRVDVSCGCGGLEDEAPLSWNLVCRNIVIIALLIICLFSNSVRSLIWLDTLTIISGSFSVYLLYVLSSQLISNQPKLSKLRESL